MQQQIQNKEGSTNSSEPSGVDLFDSYFAKKCLCIYRRIFSIEEIENSRVLQWAFGTLLFVIFIVFQRWIGDSSITIEAVLNNRHLCWPYFQSCGDWYFLSALPYGYSQTFLYMFFFGVIVLIVYLMWKRDWVLAHVFMTILFIWEFLIIFIYSSLFIGNYNYYHIILMFVLLFLPFKLFFLKVIFVILYFLSTTIKIHEGWILGTYFTSLKTGIPLFPEVLAPLVTNFVIFMQIVGAWFLLGSHKTLQRLAVFYFVAFHLYSGLLVEYRYPATVLPMLLVLFGPMYTVTSVPLNKKALAGWALIVLLFFLQFSSIIIPGDEKITLEGNQYGLYMFEANHQCISHYTLNYKDGSKEMYERESVSARNRCDPYRAWFRLQQICKRDESIDHILWQFDHSTNGGPFYRIVDENNICQLEYKPFSHNTWIKTPKEGAPIMGYPVKNLYY